MQQRNGNVGHSDKVIEAINAALDAIDECRDAVAKSNNRVVAKIAEAACVLGWPDQVVSGVVDEIQNIAEMQMKMMDYTIEVCEEQIKSCPSLAAAGHWPDTEPFKDASLHPPNF